MIKNSLRLAAGILLAFGFAFGVQAQYGGGTPAAPAAMPAVPSMAKSFHATLSGAQEVPPVPGGGKGSADFKLDAATKTLTWTVSYSGLTGDAVAAHIHGPAAPGANAGVEVPFDRGQQSDDRLGGSDRRPDRRSEQRARPTSTSTPPPTRAARSAARSRPRCKADCVCDGEKGAAQPPPFSMSWNLS